MHRFAPLFAGLAVVLLVGAAVVLRPPAAAQESTPAADLATASHPLVGAWTLATEGPDAFTSTAVFHADGTYVEVLPWGAVLLGAWAPTDGRTAVVTTAIHYLAEDTEELVQGQGRLLLEVDETGTRLAFLGSTFVGRYKDGRIDFIDDGSVPTFGVRLPAGPMLTVDELIATPVLLGPATPAAATPAP